MAWRDWPSASTERGQGLGRARMASVHSSLPAYWGQKVPLSTCTRPAELHNRPRWDIPDKEQPQSSPCLHCTQCHTWQPLPMVASQPQPPGRERRKPTIFSFLLFFFFFFPLDSISSKKVLGEETLISRLDQRK